jgi:hypothetical protein
VIISGIFIAELMVLVGYGTKHRSRLLLAEAAELRIRAAQLTMTADLLLSQAERLSARAAGLSERGLRLLEVQEETPALAAAR